MEKGTEKTKVIFRFWKESDDVIALFPEIPGNIDVSTCESYEHIGQHGACDLQGIIGSSRPSTIEEYAYLKAELENHCGYNLQVISRNSYRYTECRIKQLTR